MPNRLGRRWMALLPVQVVRPRNSVMRPSRRVIVALMLGATPVAAPGFAFDGAPANQDSALPVVSQPAAPAAQALNAQALKKAVPVAATTTTVTAGPSLNSLPSAAQCGPPV